MRVLFSTVGINT